MEVRKFGTEDAEQVSEIMKEAFRSFLGDLWTDRDEERFGAEAIAEASIQQGRFSEAVSYVAVEGGKVLGYIRGSASDTGLGTLEVVGVRPSHFGQGVGKALMKVLEEFWTSRGTRKASTCVSAHNRRALLYYIKNGFVPEGYQRDHFREGVDEIILGRFLKKKPS